MAATPDVWIDVHEERQALLCLLETLAPVQWDSPSLCSEWRVRDVVGHLISETTMTIPKVVGGFVTSGFRINRFIANDARRRGGLAVAALVEEFRSAVPTRTHLRGLSSLSMLDDIVIHSLDIRRPLNVERTVPERRMVVVAADLWASRFFPGHKLFAGVRVEATDVDWSAGEGPVVGGRIEELILAMGGRPGGLDQLDGEGIASVRQRVPG